MTHWMLRILALVFGVFMAGCFSAPATDSSSPAEPVAGLPSPLLGNEVRIFRHFTDMPEGIVRHGTDIFTIVNPYTDDRPSELIRLNVSGNETGRWIVEGQTIGPNALRPGNLDVFAAPTATDAQGRIYVVNIHPPVVFRFTVDGDNLNQQTFATFADLPPCPLATPCSAAREDRPAFPDYASFAGDFLYVSDFNQAGIWKVSSEGDAEWWFTSARFDFGVLDLHAGANGITPSPDGKDLLVAATARSSPESIAEAGLGFSIGGAIYRVPLVDAPAESDLTLFHGFGVSELVEGLHFGDAGDLYAAVISFGTRDVERRDAVVRLDSGGDETARWGPIVDGAEFWNPASLAFVGNGDLLVTNQPFDVEDPAERGRLASILRIGVDDVGASLQQPRS